MIFSTTSSISLTGSGSTLQLGSGGMSRSGTAAGTQTITCAVVLLANQGWNIAAPVGGESGGVAVTGSISGAFTIVKNGTGTLTLNTGNTHAGTTVTNGTLVVNNSSGSAVGGGLSMNAGTALGGKGVIGGTCTIAGTARITPSMGSNIATLTFTGGLDLAAGSVLDLDLGSSGTNDQLRVSGGTMHEVSPIVVNFVGMGTINPGQTYTLIDWTGAAGSATASHFTLGTTPVAGAFSVSGSLLQFTAVPRPPAALTATATPSSVNLGWTANTEPTLASYTVYRSTTSGFVPGAGNRIASGVATNSYVDSAATTGTTHYYKVTAVDIAGNESTPSNQASATTYLLEPQNVVANVISSTQINLSWTASPEATWASYKVYRSTTAGFVPGAGNLIASGLITASYNDTTVSAGTTYYYRVTAVDTLARESSPSSQVIATTLLAAPTGLNASAPPAGGINLTWTGPPGAVSYNVYRSTTSGFTPSVGNRIATSVVTASYSDASPVAAVPNYYRVTAVDSAARESAASNEASTTPALSPPAGLIATPASSSQVDLSWGAVANATGYHVYRSLTSGFTPATGNRIATHIADPTYSDTGVGDGRTYYYRTTALNGGSESASSNEASATPPNAAGIIYVKSGAPTGGDGTTWSAAYDTLVAGLAVAGTGDQIWVSGGTYLPGGGRSSTFQLKSDVRLYGGFPGVAGQEANFSVRNHVTNVTTLSGSGIAPYHVVTAAGVNSGCAVDGFTVTGGLANGSPGAATNRGGGLLVSSSNPQFVNCTFEGNSGHYGGAVSKEGSGSASFTNCLFRGNTAIQFFGGGLALTDSGTATLVNCTFSGNIGPSGGAIFNQSGTLSVTNCIAWGNTTSSGGPIGGPGSINVTFSCIEGGFAGIGNIAVDPKFVDAPNGNYRIQPYSNCVESGSTAAVPADVSDTDGNGNFGEAIPSDLDRNVRVMGTAVDMGAYEAASPVPPPATPVGLTAALLSGTQVSLDWNDNVEPNLSGYHLYRSTVAGFAISAANRVAPNVLLSATTNTVVDDGSLYYYRVTALNSAGGESLPSSAVALNTRPVAPIGVVAAGAGATQINVSWTANIEPDVVAYHVYRSIIAGFTAAPANRVGTGVTATSFPDTAGLVDGRTYYYLVTAIDGAGNESPVSLQAAATTSNVPGIIYVSATASPGGDGTSWTAPFSDLQLALAAAGTNDQIWVAQGVYKPSSGSRAVAFALKSSVAVYGGFPGLPGQENNFSIRNPSTQVTTLSGEINNPGLTGDNSYHVVTGHGTNSSAVLDGFTITAGWASGAPVPNQENAGGGFLASSGSPTVRNCIFSANLALVGGGACVLGGSTTFENCVFKNNSTGGGGNSGGGLYNQSASITMRNCSFFANNGGVGGAVYNGAFVTGSKFLNCIFSGNNAQAGGAVANEALAAGNDPQFVNCSFSKNTANVGGGFFNKYPSSLPSVVNCIFWNNTNGQIVNSNGSPGGPVTYTDVQGGYTGVGNIDSDPLFVNPLGADNTVGTDDDNLRLQAGSLCINSGSNAAAATILLDLDGHPRTLGASVDMGAYEVIPAIPFDYDHDGDVDPADRIVFVGCASRPNTPHAATADCNASDRDTDGDVDMDDFGAFQRCYSGTDQAANVNCAN